MASLKDLRDRISSVKVTQKITKAMQMVAAAKLRQAQETALSARYYAQKMMLLLTKINADSVSGDIPRLMIGTGRDRIHLVVVCTSERGLCGNFNAQIARFSRDFIRMRLAEGKIVKILTVGKKGADILKHDFADLIIDHVDLRTVKKMSLSHADSIANKIVSYFNGGDFDICTLFYAKFKSVINQKPVYMQLIPLPRTPEIGSDKKINVVYVYEPNVASFSDELVSNNISVQIFRILLENTVGEIGARVSAMDSATRNASEMINKLSIIYNRQRQAQITTDLIEIIVGAEALL